jgi:hypothetical protein
MKYLQTLLAMVLLSLSKRYRQEWQRTADRLDDQNDAVEASFRRIDAMENGGKPRIRVL